MRAVDTVVVAFVALWVCGSGAAHAQSAARSREAAADKAFQRAEEERRAAGVRQQSEAIERNRGSVGPGSSGSSSSSSGSSDTFCSVLQRKLSAGREEEVAKMVGGATIHVYASRARVVASRCGVPQPWLIAAFENSRERAFKRERAARKASAGSSSSPSSAVRAPAPSLAPPPATVPSAVYKLREVRLRDRHVKVSGYGPLATPEISGVDFERGSTEGDATVTLLAKKSGERLFARVLTYSGGELTRVDDKVYCSGGKSVCRETHHVYRGGVLQRPAPRSASVSR